MLQTRLSITIALVCSLNTLSSYAASPVDAVKVVAASEIRPTQPAIGYDEVNYKIATYKANPKKLFNDFCEDNGGGKATSFSETSRITDPNSLQCEQPLGSDVAAIKSAVIAPDHHIYLTDGHHTVSSYRAIAGDKDFQYRVRITNDLSQLPDMASFWQYMQQHNLTWLHNPQGKEISPSQLASHVGMDSMGNDPYRSVVYFLRSVAIEKPKDAPPFLEFYLGQWLRHHVPIKGNELKSKAGYMAYLNRAAEALVQAYPDEHATDAPNSPTLEQLGKLAKVNQIKLNKLAEPDGKLSKLFSQ